MNEWKNPADETPAEGEMVEIRLPGGKQVKPVEFSVGRFWKVRKGRGGHTYVVEAWRSLGAKQGGKYGENAADTRHGAGPESKD